ncbi:unnamed protein product [Closterium sp. NIES-53]
MVDFDLTYAPVRRHTSVRILICIAAVKQRPLRQIDVGSAFLYAPVDAIIFVEQPHAFKGADGAVCLLQKSLYGIKQAPRVWQQCQNVILLALSREPPLQPRAPPLAALLPPLQPRAQPLAARPPTLGPPAAPRPASRPSCSLRATTYSPLAAPCCCLPCSLRCLAPARPACCTAMASLRNHEGRLIKFDTWLDDLQLYLLSDSRDSVSLFDHTSGASPAPPATADIKCAHFGQHRTAQALYDTVVTRYSSPATTALGRLLLPYLFPELSAFAIVEDLVTHIRTSDARYRAALPAKFLDRNPPPMYITLYFIVTRLPHSLRAVKDHFLALDPTALTVAILEQHLLATETSVVAVGAAHGTPRTPFFEGCSPSPLAPSYASAAAVDVLGAEDVGAASASGKHYSSKGKGGRGGGGGSGG